MNNWEAQVLKSIIQNPLINLTTINNIELIKSFPYSENMKLSLTEILKNGLYSNIEIIDNSRKSFEDISVIRFTSEKVKIYYGLVYDSDELWQEPIVIEIFPSLNQKF